MTQYFSKFNIHDKPSVKELAGVVKEALRKIVEIVGPMAKEDTPCLKCNYLSFLITNGDVLLAHHGGKKVFFSTYKNKCADRDTCSSFSESCEAPSKDGKVNHLIFSSEPLSGENIWQELALGGMLGACNQMKVFKDSSL